MIKSTFSILFIVRKSRLGKSGEAAIAMRITVNGRFTEMNTLRKVQLSLWDQKKERAVGKGPIPIEINRHLESLRTRAYEIIKRDWSSDVCSSDLKHPKWVYSTKRKTLYFVEIQRFD